MPAPANDLVGSATAISSLPFTSASTDNTLATESVGDPTNVWNGDGTAAGAVALFKTCFWTYTPASAERIHLSTGASGIAIGVYTGSGPFVEIASAAKLTIDLVSGTAYTIMVGSETNTGHTYTLDVAISTAPANQTQQTAIDITSLLPYSGTFDGTNADDMTAGFTFSLYFKYTGQVDELLISFLAYAATFSASTRVYSGPFDIYDGNLAALDIFTTFNEAMQYPVAGGTDYFFKVARASGTAGSVAVSARRVPADPVPLGSIIVPSDSVGVGFPAAVVSRTTGEVIGAVDLPAGEWGDILSTGNFMVDDVDADTLSLYDTDYAELVNVGTLGFDTAAFEHKIRLSPTLQEFFVGRAGGGGHNASIHRVSAAGVVGTSWTLATAGLASLAANNDGSIVYLSGYGGTADIKRWSTAGGGSFLSDLIASPGVGWTNQDMLVLSDDTVVVLWSSSTQAMVKTISPAGAVLNTLTQSNDADTRVAYDPDSYATHFWLWRQLGSGLEQSVFQQIAVSTLTVSETVPTAINFSHGLRLGTPVADPERFGISPSCPFFFTREVAAVVRPVDPSDPCCCDCPAGGPIPSRTTTPGATGPILPPVLAGDWTPFCAGGGVVPTAADATDAESWVS